MSFRTSKTGALMSALLLFLASCGNAVEHKTGAGGAAPGAAAESAASATSSADAGGNEQSAESGLVGKNVSPKVAMTILDGLEKGVSVQKSDVTSINTSPIDNLYEVVIDKSEIFYVTGDGRYIMDSNIVDLRNRENLTSRRLSELNKVDVSTLPLKNAIVTSTGDGSRDIYVFADPDCPFCKRLQRTVMKMDNLKVHTFLMGLTALHPKAMEHADRIMCQKDPSKVWNDWTLSDNHDFESVVAKADACETGVLENQKFAEEIKVGATPTIIFPNGHKVSGAISEERIEAMLAEALKKN